MKIGIVGSGAMGSVYGALLADAGNDVWMFDKWQEHVDAMRTRGLRCEGASGDRTVRVEATTRAADAGPCALAIVATKVMDIEAALGAARAMIGPDTLVLAIQNGLGNVERVQRALGPDNLLFGIAGGFGAEIKGPGHVHHNGMEAINLAEVAGGITARLERVAEVWRGPGFTVKVHDDLGPVVWSKLVANVAFSAICTVTAMRVGQVRANEAAWAVARACVEEAVAVAAAKGSRWPTTTRCAGCRTSPARSRTRARRCIRTCWPGAARRSTRSTAAWSPRATRSVCRPRPARSWSIWSGRSKRRPGRTATPTGRCRPGCLTGTAHALRAAGQTHAV